MKEYVLKTFLQSIEGLVIVDSQGYVLLMEESLAKDCWIDGEQMDAEKVVGRPITEVIPTTKIIKCLKEGATAVGDYYFVEGRAIVSTRKPVYLDNKLIGAIEFDLFGVGGEFLSEFLNRTEIISKNQGNMVQQHKNFKHAKYTIDAIVGISDTINRVKEEIKIASKYNSTVLIEAKTGCGKELVAHSIHALSDRQLKPFISVNCAAIPETLVESELFGYDEGAFTGAKPGGSIGKVEQAHGGTLFLDEINQLPLSAQPKLLRFLQEHEITHVGGDKNIEVDARVIVSSNESLKELVEKGEFREDLYYRLNVIDISILPLKDRPEDIPVIVRAMIPELNKQLNREITDISPEAMMLLENHIWPGNVRELRNVVERAINHCQGNILKKEHFTDRFDKGEREEEKLNVVFSKSLEDIRADAERQAIEKS